MVNVKGNWYDLLAWSTRGAGRVDSSIGCLRTRKRCVASVRPGVAPSLSTKTWLVPVGHVSCGLSNRHLRDERLGERNMKSFKG
jgi:hypothetical protein